MWKQTTFHPVMFQSGIIDGTAVTETDMVSASSLAIVQSRVGVRIPTSLVSVL